MPALNYARVSSDKDGDKTAEGRCHLLGAAAPSRQD